MGPSPSRGHVILFPKANQAELASGSQLFPSNPLGSGSGARLGVADLLCCGSASPQRQPPRSSQRQPAPEAGGLSFSGG